MPRHLYLGDIALYPAAKLSLVELAGCERSNRQYGIFFWRNQFEIIELQKRVYHSERDSFGAARKAMIPCEAKSVGCGQLRQCWRWFCVTQQLLRTGQR